MQPFDDATFEFEGNCITVKYDTTGRLRRKRIWERERDRERVYLSKVNNNIIIRRIWKEEKQKYEKRRRNTELYQCKIRYIIKKTMNEKEYEEEYEKNKNKKIKNKKNH